MSAGGATRTWRCGPAAFRGALEQFRAMGGAVAGGESEGTLGADTPLGRLEGRYRFDGEELSIEVTSKPPLLPLEMVWARLDAVCGPPVSRA